MVEPGTVPGTDARSARRWCPGGLRLGYRKIGRPRGAVVRVRSGRGVSERDDAAGIIGADVAVRCGARVCGLALGAAPGHVVGQRVADLAGVDAQRVKRTCRLLLTPRKTLASRHLARLNNREPSADCSFAAGGLDGQHARGNGTTCLVSPRRSPVGVLQEPCLPETADECLQTLAPRVGENLGRQPLLDDQALVDEQ